MTRQDGDDPNDLAVIIRTMMETGQVPPEVLENPLRRAAFVPNVQRLTSGSTIRSTRCRTTSRRCERFVLVRIERLRDHLDDAHANQTGTVGYVCSEVSRWFSLTITSFDFEIPLPATAAVAYRSKLPAPSMALASCDPGNWIDNAIR